MKSSPYKQQLLARYPLLEPLEKKKRIVLETGGQSVVLIDRPEAKVTSEEADPPEEVDSPEEIDNSEQVLIVTRKLVAKNIELLYGLKGCPFEVPKVVAIDADMAELLDYDNPKKARKLATELKNIPLPQLWTKNVVYSMTRCTGNLHKFNKIRFKEDTIDLVEKTLTRDLKFLHKNNLTHNDISLNNIYYTGDYESKTFKIYLGDFGEVTQNDAKSHPQKCQQDLLRLKMVIAELRSILVHKKAQKESLGEVNKNIPGFYNLLMMRMGTSPDMKIVKAKKEPPKRETKPRIVKKLF